MASLAATRATASQTVGQVHLAGGVDSPPRLLRLWKVALLYQLSTHCQSQQLLHDGCAYPVDCGAYVRKQQYFSRGSTWNSQIATVRTKRCQVASPCTINQLYFLLDKLRKFWFSLRGGHLNKGSSPALTERSAFQ